MNIPIKPVSLVQLPPELLYHIFAFLNAYDLVRIRRTCKVLKFLMDDSELQKYIIDLCYFQMVQLEVATYEIDVSLVKRRKWLTQNDAAWQNIQYRQKRTYHFPASPTNRIVGGVYGSDRRNHIHFERLPSTLDPGGVHSWSHPVEVTTFLDFTFCPEQDLLVTLHRNEFRSVCDIHLLSLTTNAVHPEVAHSVLKTNISSASQTLYIIGNYIVILFQGIIRRQWTIGDGMQIWDWKSKNGYQCNLWFHEEIHTCTFLEEDKFLVVTGGAMKIYSFSDKSKVPQCTARLSLPPLMDDWSYRDAFISMNPIPCSVSPYSHKSLNQPSCFFHPSGDDQLVMVRIKIRLTVDPEFCCYIFFIRHSAVLQLEKLYAKRYNQSIPNDPELPWSMWGPQHTTWFDENDIYQRHSVYGFRTAGIYESLSGTSNRLVIRDFNPHISWDHNTGNTTRWRGKLVRGELDTAIRSPFAEPIGSALSYSEIVSEELFDADQISLDESRVILRKYGDDDNSQTVDILVF